MKEAILFGKIWKTAAASRLRNRFILFFIILSAVPALVLGGLTLYLVGVSHSRNVSMLQIQLIDHKIEEINKFFADTLGILDLRVGFDEQSEEQFWGIALSDQKFLLQGFLEGNPAIDSAAFVNLQGGETSKLARGVSSPQLEIISRLPKFAAAKEGERYIGNIYHTLSGPFVAVASPVRNRNGDVIMVLTAEVNLSEIANSIKSSSLGSEGYLILADKNGRIIASGGKNTVPGADISVFERVRRVMRGETLDGLDARDRYESILEGVPSVGAAKKIPGMDWMIFSEWPARDADVVINGVRNRIAAVTLLSILVVLFVAPYFANRLLKPIRALEKGAAEIEQGNLDAVVNIRTGDELEDLGGAFNKMAAGLRRLQELRNEFVFIAAHELRTPVTAIKGYLSMIREGSAGDLSETMRRYLEPVWLSNERLVKLVNDVLEIARSEAGKLKVEVAPYDIREAVRAIQMEIKPIADEKKISVSYDRPETLPMVSADEGRVKEIIMNFVSNGVKYNRPEGWVRIYHETERGFVITHVEDNGFGMNAEEQRHMFEKFFRAESGAAKAVQGTGLGMFITKELIEKMGGRVWFHSLKDKGTRFSFALPVAEAGDGNSLSKASY